jgi:hypothetical protein
MYQGFPEIVYETRDWDSKDKDARVTRTRRHDQPGDVGVYDMFAQSWPSTALGFAGLGGQAFTTAYTVILESQYESGCCVYFGGRFAYYVARPNEQFFTDITQRSMAPVKEHSKYER